MLIKISKLINLLIKKSTNQSINQISIPALLPRGTGVHERSLFQPEKKIICMYLEIEAFV